MTVADRAPLLVESDLQPPLELDFLSNAAFYMEEAGVEPDDVAHEALGFYLRKRREEVEGNHYFSSKYLQQTLGRELEELPGVLQESTLLADLVADYRVALDNLHPQARRWQLPDIFGLRKRRDIRQRLETDRERLASLKERASYHASFDMAEFQVGDRVAFYSEMSPHLGIASSVLKGKVENVQTTNYGPAILVQVTEDEKRKGDMVFTDPPFGKGAEVRIIGTVLWGNGRREEPSTMKQRNVLEFLDNQGTPTVRDKAVIQYKNHTSSDFLMPLLQVNINGIDIFLPHQWA